MLEARRELQLFSPDVTGIFVERPNRFVMVAEVGGELLRTHCPNPGRMQEILLPGTETFLEKGDSPSRSTSHTFVAAVHRGEIIALHSTRANDIARELILPQLIKGSESIRREAVFGRSRFDFAIKTKEGIILVDRDRTIDRINVTIHKQRTSGYRLGMTIVNVVYRRR